jgi:hypothetical protein
MIEETLVDLQSKYVADFIEKRNVSYMSIYLREGKAFNLNIEVQDDDFNIIFQKSVNESEVLSIIKDSRPNMPVKDSSSESLCIQIPVNKSVNQLTVVVKCFEQSSGIMKKERFNTIRCLIEFYEDLDNRVILTNKQKHVIQNIN